MDESSYLRSVYERDGWYLLVQESGKHGANLLLERGNGSEWVGTVPYEKLDGFIEFMNKLSRRNTDDL